MNGLWIIYCFVSGGKGGGGGGGRVGKVVRGSKPPAPHTLPSWLPSLLPWFLTPRAFAIAKYWALYCCVISPISLASIHNKEFLPPVLPSLTSLSTFLLDSHNPLLSHYKWFNTKLLVGLCCSFTIIQKKKIIIIKLIGTASLQVTFEGIKGPSFQSDIAIDDVSIVDGSCPGKKSNEFVRRKETVVIIFL